MCRSSASQESQPHPLPLLFLRSYRFSSALRLPNFAQFPHRFLCGLASAEASPIRRFAAPDAIPLPFLFDARSYPDGIRANNLVPVSDLRFQPFGLFPKCETRNTGKKGFFL